MARDMSFIAILFLLLSLYGCTSQEIPAPGKAPALESKVEPSTAKATWEVDWNKTISDAGKEKKLVVFAGISADVRKAIIDALRDKFNLAVEFYTGRGSELTRKLIMERKAGIYNADVGILGSGSSIMELKPQGDILEPFESLLIPEIVEPDKWRMGKLDWIDKDKLALAYTSYVGGHVTINTNLVKTPELTAWKDLLQPRWKGKLIIQDPTTPGSGNMWFSVIGGNTEGFDYMRQIVKQEPVIMRDVRQMAEWLAVGKYPVGIAITTSVVYELQNAGAPIKNIDLGGYLSAGWNVITVFSKRPHPSATRVFINWLLSREGQTIYTKVDATPSGRIDVPAEGLDTLLIPKPGVNYFRSYSEEFALKREEYTPISREIFGALMR